jgi:hypothetical protein
MPSPGLEFRSFTAAELSAALTTAKARLVAGDWTSVSGGAKSGTKTTMTPQDMISAITAEMRFRGLLAPLANVVYADFRTNKIDGF